ncbi:MAG: PEGA domain-containing protein [Vicinamibacterales bacterium]
MAFLVLGILIGFAGGYTSVLFDDRSPSVAPPRTVPARADEPAPFSAAAAGAGATNDAWEDLPVGTPSGTAAAVEPDSGTATTLSAPTPPTTIPVASDVSPRGSIEVVSRPPGAEVALDGRVVGTTPVSIPDVIEGTHVVGIELDGFSRWATSVYVSKGERARVGASLTP